MTFVSTVSYMGAGTDDSWSMIHFSVACESAREDDLKIKGRHGPKERVPQQPAGDLLFGFRILTREEI